MCALFSLAYSCWDSICFSRHEASTTIELAIFYEPFGFSPCPIILTDSHLQTSQLGKCSWNRSVYLFVSAFFTQFSLPTTTFWGVFWVVCRSHLIRLLRWLSFSLSRCLIDGNRSLRIGPHPPETFLEMEAWSRFFSKRPPVSPSTIPIRCWLPNKVKASWITKLNFRSTPRKPH